MAVAATDRSSRREYEIAYKINTCSVIKSRLIRTNANDQHVLHLLMWLVFYYYDTTKRANFGRPLVFSHLHLIIKNGSDSLYNSRN